MFTKMSLMLGGLVTLGVGFSSVFSATPADNFPVASNTADQAVIVVVAAPYPVIGTNPQQCSTSFSTCMRASCAPAGAPCDQEKVRACQRGYDSCLAPLPQQCVYGYLQCRALNASTGSRSGEPCSPEGCVSKRDCLVEYHVCSSTP